MQSNNVLKKVVDVAIGIIVRQQQVLLALRPEHVAQGGLWEFPGGKIEKNETAYQALCRELNEELGITVTSASPLPKVSYCYPNYQVQLFLWQVTAFQNEATGCEGQQVLWVPWKEIGRYEMPAASYVIVQMLEETTIFSY